MLKIRMSYYILGTKPYYKELSSIEEGKNMIDIISSFINAKVEEGVFPDHNSFAVIEKFDEQIQDWVPYDEDDLECDEYCLNTFHS